MELRKATFRWLSLVATLALLPPHPISFTLPGATPPYTLTFRAPPKVVTGVVETNTGTPVRDAQVVAHRLDKGGHARTLTGAGGDYRINLSDGLWALTVKAVNTTVPSHWVYPKPPQLVHFRHDPEPERKRVGFTVVTADAEGWASATHVVTPTLHNGAPIQAGTFTILVPGGTYRVAAHLPAGSPTMSTGERRVTLAVKEKDARIVGGLWGPRKQLVIAGVDAGVAA